MYSIVRVVYRELSIKEKLSNEKLAENSLIRLYCETAPDIGALIRTLRRRCLLHTQHNALLFVA